MTTVDRAGLRRASIGVALPWWSTRVAPAHPPPTDAAHLAHFPDVLTADEIAARIRVLLGTPAA